ncbi:MAG: kelch repeat-containing protein, partial [Chloroflexota bacterium]
MPGVRGPEAIATLLRDGRVLVVGRGIGPNQQLADSAVIYDPSTARWSATETVPMGIGSATRLADGTVLVTGGGPSGSSAERYDPTTGRWTATGTMTVGRPEYSVTKDGSGWDPAGYTATLLLDGKVLVAGGRTSPPGTSRQTVVPNAELYDPDTGRWTTTGSMVHARVGHTATLLPDGKVLVVGGATYHTDSSLSDLGSSEVYDPATGSWTAAGKLHDARAFHTATLLADGSVLIAGG